MADAPPHPFRSFEHDVASERGVMWLRGVAALWTLVCVVWLGIVLRTWVGLAFGLVGTVIALLWAAMIARARRRVRGGTVALRLTPEALSYDDGARTIEIAWRDVRGVDVDEERIAVRIERAEGEAELVEPLFRGVGVYELAEAVRAAWRASRDPEG